MKTLKLIQGTPEWHETRAKCFTASEAPAMMGSSKYLSREKLLRQKKTGQTDNVSPAQQAIFDKGHATEAAARPIVEAMIGEELYPVTGLLEDTKYLASFDGLTMMEDIGFEHKLWNETLAENVRLGVLEPHYFWQLEQQLLVSGAEKIIFVVSDGTENNFESMDYFPVEGRKEALIAGWEQFEKDLDGYAVEAKAEVAVAEENTFPALTALVNGSLIESNVNDVLAFVKSKAEAEIDKPLATDLDFANAEQLVKDVKKVRANLKQSVTSVRGEFVSYSEFCDITDQIDSVLQKLQSTKEKAVKSEKEKRKGEIIDDARAQLADHIQAINERLSKATIPSVTADFAGAVKGKRNIDSMKDAVKQELASAKIGANKTAAAIEDNLRGLAEEAEGYEFLFNDLQQIILKDNSDFINLVKLRIAEHKQAEENRKEAKRIAAEQAAAVKHEEPAPSIVHQVTEPEMSKEIHRNFVRPSIEAGIASWLREKSGISHDQADFIAQALIAGQVPHISAINPQAA